MKKNVMMRLASFLLVAVLISTSAISGTYAKYVTQGNSQDTARVAKWGVTVTGKSDMFATSYDEEDAVYELTTESVISSGTDNVLAPGTEGSFVDTEITGTPEVAVRITAEADVTIEGPWYYEGTGGLVFYCPLTITVGYNTNDGSKTEVLYGCDYANAAAFEAAIEGAITKMSKDFEPKTDLSTIDNDMLDITWEWAFEGTDGKQTDARDTELGNHAADLGATYDDLKITVSVTTIVTQID